MKKYLYVIIMLLIIILLSSCATTYNTTKLSEGYQDQQISTDTYLIRFLGNSHTSNYTAYIFFLTRAAEIAIQHGYSGFYLLETKDITSYSQFISPGYSTSTSSGSIHGNYYQYGNVGRLYGTINSSTTTTIIPPYISTVSRPAYMGLILLVNEKIENGPDPFNAKMVYNMGMEENDRVKTRNTNGILIKLGVLFAIIIFSAIGASTNL